MGGVRARIALTIAGSDPSGGAGIQADLKTFHQFGVYGMSVLTLLTVQNTCRVSAVEMLPAQFVLDQLDAVLEDLPPHAAKTGALGSREVIEAIADRAAHFAFPLVVDPVMISKHGAPLLQEDARATLARRLLLHAFLVTPNVHEAQQLSGIAITSLADARRAAKVIHGFGCKHVLIKGGHLLTERATDLLYDGRFFNVFKGEFIDTPHTHGTGCTFASAIAAHLARGKSMNDAVQTAKTYLTEALRHSLAIGHGTGPTNHFYFLQA